MTSDPNIMPEPDPHLEVVRPDDPPLEESEFPDKNEAAGAEHNLASDHGVDDPDADRIHPNKSGQQNDGSVAPLATPENDEFGEWEPA